MADVTYRQIAVPTDPEIAAARAYRSESGFFHLACEADHGMALSGFKPYQHFLFSGKLAALKSATSSRYELTAEATVYSGHGNGSGAVGALGHSDFRRFVGLIWRYRGFTSTTASRLAGEGFVFDRAKSPLDTPVFLEFRLPAGFRLFPMATLGPDATHEAEFLISPGRPFEIVTASHVTIGSAQKVLHLSFRVLSCDRSAPND
jgi:hypothetical protein